MDALGLTAEVHKSLVNEMNELLDARRSACASALKHYLVTSIRKKVVPDLDKRLEEFNKRIDRMMDGITIEFVDNEFVVKTTGSAEGTWKTLLRGSDWFEPVPDAMEIMLSPLSQ